MTYPAPRQPTRYVLTRREVGELDHFIDRARKVLTRAKGGRAACTAAALRMALRLRAGTPRHDPAS
jgi:hypothetical protein